MMPATKKKAQTASGFVRNADGTVEGPVGPRDERGGAGGMGVGEAEDMKGPPSTPRPKAAGLPMTAPAPAREHQNGSGAWEDSTVGSMLDSERESDWNRKSHARHYSETVGLQQPHVSRALVMGAPRATRIENLPFMMVSDGAMMRPMRSGGAVAGRSVDPVASVSAQLAAMLHHPPPGRELLEQGQVYEVTPTKLGGRQKLGHGDGREDERKSEADSSRSSWTDKSIKKVRIETDQRKQGRQQRRSTITRAVDPSEDTSNFDDTRAAVGASIEVATEDFEEAPQRWPRASLQPPANPKVVKQDARDAQFEATENGQAKAVSKKRSQGQFTCDYDDAALYNMSFSQLCRENFDYNPQAETNLPSSPTSGTVDQKMRHYVSKDSDAQHQFFAGLSVGEWDQAGDWLMDRFAGVMQSIREARKEKRGVLASFEKELAARQDAVQAKTEGVGRTLEDLKQEGWSMMKGKHVD